MRRTFLFYRGMPTLPFSLVIQVLGALLLWLPYLSSLGHAQSHPITPSGLNTQVNLSQAHPAGETQYDITGGTRPGGVTGTNLFHSFGDFNVPNKNIANFLNDSGLATSNILGRVTGGNISNIFGTIQTTGFGNANLFLMNPTGFLFGPNATVNVGGMVAFTSADYLRLTDGARFNAIPSATTDALLSTTPVAAFGFLGSNPGAITVQGSQLSVTPGESITLVGGNITIQPGTLDNGTVQTALLSARGGQINLASVASPGEVLAGTLAQAPNINGQSLGALGMIQISQQSVIDVSGDGGGTVLIRGGRFVIDDSTISANVAGPGPITNGVESIGGGIDIQVSQDAVIQNLAVLETNIVGNATSDVQYGGVHVQADHIEIVGVLDPELFPFTGIRSNILPGSMGGNTGTINLEANSILGKDLGQIETFNEGAGDAGNISLTATQNIDLNTVLIQSVSSDAAGSAGNIDLASTNGNISITFSLVTSQASFSDGPAGTIKVNAPHGDILLTDQTSLFNNAFNAGPIGGIEITAKNLLLDGGSTIGGNNLTVLTPGNITVTLSGSLNLDGKSGIHAIAQGPAPAAALTIRAHNITVTGGSSLTTETQSSGAGGALNISTETLQLTNGGQLRSSSVVGIDFMTGEPVIPSGAGGTVTIQRLASPAQSVLIDGSGSGIFTDTQGTGAGGNIFVNADSVTLQNRGAMSAQASGKGNAGNITIAADQVSLTNLSRLTTSTSGKGAGGTIQVSAEDTISAVDSFITASSNSTGPGAGSGGQVILNASTIDVAGGDIRTATLGSGNAGDVQIQAGTFRLGASENASGLVEATTSGSGHGGNISILGIDGPGSRANDVTLSDSSSLRSETIRVGAGTAGNITVDTVGLTLREGSEITTASHLNSPGNAGNVTLDANESVLVSGSFVTSDVFEASTGNGGKVIIKTPNLIVNQRSDGTRGQISTGTGSSGNAGSVTINANSVTLTNGGRVTSSSFLDPGYPPATGAAGTVVVQGIIGAGSQANSIVINGQDGSGAASGIFTNTDGSGRGGSIALFANSVALQNGGTLSAATSGTSSTAIGGTIMVEATNTVTMNSASITASSKETADAGNIDITSPNGFTMQNSTIATQGGPGASGGNIKVTTSPSATMLLENSKISASVADGRGGGGNISIDPQYVILQNSQILAKAADGQGGAITITANLFLPDANSIVNADANPGSGVNGTVTIQSPNAPISGHIQPLDKSPLIATSLLNQHCASLAGGEFSSFTVAGRDSLPTEPGSWLASPLAIGLTKTGDTLTEKGGGHAGIDVAAARETTVLSLRQIAPAGFLTQAFAVERSSGCQS